jgi:cellulose synthase/poly-beta-1,6-N-acetylglucosamine synthase-like glycosyltransferase
MPNDYFAVMVWLLVAFLLLVPYSILLLLYKRWWKQLPVTKPPVTFTPAIQFSIIIPARNEQINIGVCLQSIEQLNYPKHLFEVIVIDDFSEDATVSAVKEFKSVRVIELKDVLNEKINSYKKKAIEIGIENATTNYIVATDADCIVPNNWLRNFAWIVEQQQSIFIAAPVTMKEESTFINLFQSLDFLSLQGITAASVGAGFHSMCNGANLCYSKKAFHEVGGFRDIDTIASGDDMLLMHKLYKQFPTKVHYCKAEDSIVLTSPVEKVSEFFRQRIRWASKADKYDDKRIFWVLLLVYLLNIFLVLLFVAAFFNTMLWILLAGCLLFKTIIELIFLMPVATFFQKEKLLLWFPLAQPFHIIYTVVAGWLGKFGSYEWKGREVN